MIRRLRAAILCDDVRREDTGKALIIGAYGRVLLVGQKPSLVEATIYLTFDTDTDETPIEFRISALTQRIGTMTLRGSEGYTTLSIPTQIALTEPRKLMVEYRNPGEAWLEAAEWELRFTEDAIDAPAELADWVRSVAARLEAEAQEAGSRS